MNKKNLIKNSILELLKNLNKIGYRYASSTTNTKKVINSFHRHHLSLILLDFLQINQSLLKSQDILNLKRLTNLKKVF